MPLDTSPPRQTYRTIDDHDDRRGKPSARQLVFDTVSQSGPIWSADLVNHLMPYYGESALETTIATLLREHRIESDDQHRLVVATTPT